MLGTRLQGAAGPVWWRNIIYGGMQYLQEKLILFLLRWYEPESADGEETCWNVAIGLHGFSFFFFFFYTLQRKDW